MKIHTRCPFWATPAVVLLAVTLAVPHAWAQGAAPAPVRGFISIGGVYRATSRDFRDSSTFRANAEDGRLNADYSVDGGLAFDLAAGAIVWRQLGAGVAVTRFARSTPLAISATVPHPFFFNQPRLVEGEIGGLRREELAIHLQARALLPLRGPVQAMVFGGPSVFRVRQGVVTEVQYAEEYPYDAATLGRTVTAAETASALGYHVGADVAYFFTRQMGVGFGGQFSSATIEVPSPAGGSTDVKAGGFQAGGGLRLRF